MCIIYTVYDIHFISSGWNRHPQATDIIEKDSSTQSHSFGMRVQKKVSKLVSNCSSFLLELAFLQILFFLLPLLPLSISLFFTYAQTRRKDCRLHRALWYVFSYTESFYSLEMVYRTSRNPNIRRTKTVAIIATSPHSFFRSYRG